MYGRVWMCMDVKEQYLTSSQVSRWDPGSGFILVEPGSIGRGPYFCMCVYKINVARVKQLLF